MNKQWNCLNFSLIIFFFLIYSCGMPSPTASIPSGKAYLTGTISASVNVSSSGRFLGVFIHSTVLSATNSGTNAGWATISTGFPITYTIGVEPGAYVVYAWLDNNGNLTNDSGDYDGWAGGGIPVGPNITLEEGKTNTCNLTLNLK